MSIKARSLATCSSCKAKQEIDVYKSINAVTDPELKARVLSGEAFLWECPQCGKSNLSSFECLYHDPQQKFMVWLLPFGEPEGPEKDAIMRQTRAMGDYRLRIVENPGELIEKVLIFDAGLSDRCMELVKFVSLKEMPTVSNLHFFRVQDESLVFSGVRGDRMESFGVGLNVYEDCEGILSRNSSLTVEAGFCRIGPDWVSSILA